MIKESDIEMTDKNATLKNMLLCGLKPIGKCLYVYGGGWNDDNTGAGIETKSFGMSERWERFYNENDSLYDYEKTKYRIHDGLDCTGYIGWLMYQIFGDKYSNNGYVFPSGSAAAKNRCLRFRFTRSLRQWLSQPSCFRRFFGGRP